MAVRWFTRVVAWCLHPLDAAKRDRTLLIVSGASPAEVPSEEYFERLNAFDNVIRECMHLSHAKAGMRAPSVRYFYASVLFVTLLTRAVSLISLLPYSPWAQKLIEHWDYATAMGVVRTMLEIRIAFFYLCVEQCTEDERNCRWNAFNLHDCLSRKKMFHAMGDTKGGDKFDTDADELRNHLNASAYFKSLPKGTQKQVHNGKTAYLAPLEKIVERTGLDVSQFRWLYVFFSNHVHGYPMSFYRMGRGFADRGRGVYSRVEENYTKLCISLALKMLVSSRDEFRHLFADVSDVSE